MDKKVLFSIVGLIVILIGVTPLFADGTRKVMVGKLNINEASSQDFLLFPGIGEKTTYRIVKYREEVGGFKAIAQIKRVKGVGDAVFNRIKDHLTLTERSDLKEANAIIDYRKRNKGFKKVEDISLAGISRQT